MISGFATAAGTERYRSRFPQQRDAQNFRRAEWVRGAGDLWLSSIGMGTYLGEPTPELDLAYTEAAASALGSGINVLDTAINYRHQRSERNLGAALVQLIASGNLHRDEVLVCTKAGYLTFDATVPADPRSYFRREYVETGILDPGELAGGMHSMAPRFLEDQLERSRRNLGLETIDVFYLHNPETQLQSTSLEVFQKRLQDAFAALELAVAAGRIRYYGTATWNGFRVPPGQPGYMSIEEVVQIARETGGEDHHFRFVQLPFNVAMPGAWGLHNQPVDGQNLPLLEAACRLGVAVIGSATLHQGALAKGMPEFISQRLGMAHDWENAIQFSRSAPGMVTALVGMSQSEHVRVNAAVASRAPAAAEDWKKLFQG